MRKIAYILDAVIQLKDNFSNTLKTVDKTLGGFGRTTQNLGKQVQRTGKDLERMGASLTKAVTLPVAAAAGAAVKSAIDFESAFTGVVKTVDATDEQLATLRQDIRDMAKEIPATADEIARVAESAGQLGIAVPNIKDFSRVMIDLGEATNLAADEAATELARFANITRMPQTEFDRLGSTVVALGNNLATTEREIVDMGMRLAGAGAQIGLTEAQIVAMAGALSSVGIEAEMGGSAFSRVMVNMRLAVETGSKELKDFAKVAGMTTSEFSAAFKKDAGSAITAFIQGLGNAESQGSSAIKVLDDMGITEIRLRDTLLRASGASEVFTESLEIGTKAWDENIALTEEVSRRYATTASQIKIAKNNLRDIGITLGDRVLPHITALTTKLKAAAEWFSKLSPETQNNIVKFALFAAAIGPTLLIAGKLTTGIGGLIVNFGKFSSAVKKVGLLSAIFSPGVIVVGVILALIAATILLVKNWDKVKAVAKRVGKAISEATGITRDDIQSLIGVFKRFGTNVWAIVQRIGESFKPLAGKIGGVISRIVEVMKPLMKVLAPILGFITGLFIAQIIYSFLVLAHVVETAIVTITGIIGGILTVLSGVIDFLVGVFTGDWSRAWDGVKTIFGGVVEIINAVWEGLVGLLTAPVEAILDILDSVFHDKVAGVKKAWEGIKEFFKNPISGTVNLVKKGWNAVTGGGVGQNYTGTTNWRGGLTTVHERGGEIIDLPRGSRVYPHDESVQMAREQGRREVSSRSISIAKLADTLIVREEADIDKITTALVKKLTKTEVAFGGAW